MNIWHCEIHRYMLLLNLQHNYKGYLKINNLDFDDVMHGLLH